MRSLPDQFAINETADGRWLAAQALQAGRTFDRCELRADRFGVIGHCRDQRPPSLDLPAMPPSFSTV